MYNQILVIYHKPHISEMESYHAELKYKTVKFLSSESSISIKSVNLGILVVL